MDFDNDLARDLKLYKSVMGYKSPRNITVFGSARIACERTTSLAYELAKRGHNIITGGGPGLMQSANKGARKAQQDGANITSIGINIKLPFEQHPNGFCDEVFEFVSMSMRRKALIDISDSFIIGAGGFGTLDEMFEIITLAQTGLRAGLRIVLLNFDGFYDELLGAFESFKKRGVIDDTYGFVVASDIQGALDVFV